jgi:hypothetical protein
MDAMAVPVTGALGSAGKAFHNIYIWDKNMGNLVKILEGPKEGLEDLCVRIRPASWLT